MRSTLVLDDRLIKLAKQRAAELHLTLSELVNHALRDLLSKPTPKVGRFQMPVFGGPSRSTHYEPENFAAAEIADDVAGLRAAGSRRRSARL